MKNSFFRSNRTSLNSKNKKRYIIGISGTHSGVGVTHSAILLATYFREIRNASTAVLEMNRKKDFSYLESAYKGGKSKGKERFRIRENKESSEFTIYDVRYFKDVREDELSFILNRGFEYYILDFGSESPDLQKELLRCDYKFIITSLSEWRHHKLLEHYRYFESVGVVSEFVYLAVFGQSYDKKSIQSEHKVPVHLLGYEPDPFLISRKTINLFGKMIR